MSFRHLASPTWLWASVAALLLQGCMTPITRTGSSASRLESSIARSESPAAGVQPVSYQADWEDDWRDEEEINEDLVQQTQMMLQRAQAEFRTGASFPFDLLDPSTDPEIDIGGTVGTKFSFEIFKNLYLGGTFDWTRHTVDELPQLSDEQIAVVDEFDRYNFLVSADWDIPLWQHHRAILVRVGFATGLVFLSFEPASGRRDLEDIYRIVFRPSVGLRWPTTDNILIFTEFSFDFIPEVSLQDEDNRRVTGDRPIFDRGTLWLGIAFQWE